MITETRLTIKCDHPGCTKIIRFPILQGKTIMENLRARGWQPYAADDYCPEHRKED